MSKEIKSNAFTSQVRKLNGQSTKTNRTKFMLL